MTLPSPSDFFQTDIENVISQGDIVLSPSSVLWADSGTLEAEFGRVPSAPAIGETVITPAWDTYDRTRAPDVFHHTRWSPVIVLSHPCEMEKEFNRRVKELIADGMSPNKAIHTASLDPELDRYIVVTPLLPYSELPESEHEGVRSGQRIGYFPVPLHESFEEETFAPLSRACTVDRALLMKHEQIASLTLFGVGILRYKISECFTARDLSVIAELEEMVGETIDDVLFLPKSRKACSLQLYLHSGKVVHLEIRQPREGFLDEVRRLGIFR